MGRLRVTARSGAGRRRARRLARLSPAFLALVMALGCMPGDKRPAPPPTRGYLLISLDSIAATHLGAYGANGDVTPFFDQLATQGVLFERAFAQSPSSLVSHASMWTGLYPDEHGASPPSATVADSLPLVPEVFGHFGFRTAGHTEGGFVSRDYGFHRGFDEFSDPLSQSDTDVEETFARGLDFLRRLDDGQRFLLVLQTGSAGSPYRPPPSEADATSDSPPPFPEDGAADLRAINLGFRPADREAAGVFAARHRAGLRYLDGVLADLFTELDRLGLRSEMTTIITAAHGEEFLEHGRLGHTQTYPENIRVPLLVLHPELTGRRVPEVVELVDLAPTLYDLARLPSPAPISGESLAPLLRGERRERSVAYAEAGRRPVQRTLVRREGGTTHQLVSTRIPGERDGTWVTRRAAFDTAGTPLELSLVSFERPRPIRVLLEGEEIRRLEVGTGWTPLRLELPADRSRYRLELVAPDCRSPRQLGLSEDGRCLSFKLRGTEVILDELFDLDADPGAERDLGSERPLLHRELAAELRGLEWSILAAPERRPIDERTAETLRALGYLD